MQRGQKMSDDNFIRNPNRKNQQERHITYEPEHVRLGIKPIIMERKTVPFVKSSKNDAKDFASVNGAIFDDNGNEIKVEPGQVIDNNDYVFPPTQTPNRPAQQQVERQTVEEQSDLSDKQNGTPKVGEYILMVSGKIVHTGSLGIIESAARAILYGESESFQEEVNVDDIVVLKRVGISVGIFIDR